MTTYSRSPPVDTGVYDLIECTDYMPTYVDIVRALRTSWETVALHLSRTYPDRFRWNPDDTQQIKDNNLTVPEQADAFMKTCRQRCLSFDMFMWAMLQAKNLEIVQRFAPHLLAKM